MWLAAFAVMLEATAVVQALSLERPHTWQTLSTAEKRSLDPSSAEGAGFHRFDWVTAFLRDGDKLARSSAPHYDTQDSDQKLTPESIAFLKNQNIVHVISVNGEANNPAIVEGLKSEGIDYTPIALEDYQTPTFEDIKTAYNAFTAHRSGTLVWCGYGHGRTGTIVSAIQIYTQSENPSAKKLSRKDFENNNVETLDQFKLLETLQMVIEPGAAEKQAQLADGALNTAKTAVGKIKAAKTAFESGPDLTTANIASERAIQAGKNMAEILEFHKDIDRAIFDKTMETILETRKEAAQARILTVERYIRSLNEQFQAGKKKAESTTDLEELEIRVSMAHQVVKGMSSVFNVMEKELTEKVAAQEKVESGLGGVDATAVQVIKTLGLAWLKSRETTHDALERELQALKAERGSMESSTQELKKMVEDAQADMEKLQDMNREKQGTQREEGQKTSAQGDDATSNDSPRVENKETNRPVDNQGATSESESKPEQQEQGQGQGQGQEQEEEAGGIDVEDILSEMSPIKPLTDLADAIRNDKPVSAAEWVGLIGDVGLEIAAWVPTPAAPVARALRFARTAYKAAKAIRKGLKTAMSAGKSVKQANQVAKKLEKALKMVKVEVPVAPKVPGASSTKSVTQSAADITKAVDKVKLPAPKADPHNYDDLLKQLEAMPVADEPLGPIMASAVRKAGARRTKEGVSLPSRRAVEDSDERLVKYLLEADAFKKRGEKVPLEILFQIIDAVSRKLSKEADDDDQDQQSFLDDSQLWDGLEAQFNGTAVTQR